MANFYYGDFFPLTEYSADESAWMAWQWGNTDGTAGIVQAFRREKSRFTSASFQLHHLREDRNYTVEDLDSRQTVQISGKDLVEKGVPVAIRDAPGAVILRYYETASP
ncbi:MAG: hypothetical protein M3Y57_11085 [Acidobacteriota bacterium]|nr:hypothetical protein [Acidobacteriota bacterium]